MDQRDQAPAPQRRHRMVPDRPPRLGGQSAPPGRRHDHVGQLDLQPPRHLLVEQAAMADQPAADLLDRRPEIEGRLLRQRQIFLQRPADRIEPARPAHVGGGGRIAPQGRQRLHVLRRERADDQPVGLDDRPSAHCMNQPWLTTTDWPVSAVVGKAANSTASSATSPTVVNSPSTVSFSITFLTTSSSLIPSSLACSGICLSTSGVRTKPGQITLARTPYLAPSFATVLHRPIRPCLAVT